MNLEPAVDEQYQRALSELTDVREEQKFLSAREVLKAHFLIANHFYLEGYGIAGIGPRNIDLLMSAVSRQYTSFGGVYKWTDRFDICGTLFYGLIKNHPFYDANKRTAFLSALYLLEKYDFCPSATEQEFENLTVLVAENGLSRFRRYQELMTESADDPEVRYISWFFRKNVRKIDKKNYSITYRELQTILNRYGFKLSNPYNNHIDIIKMKTVRTLFGLGPVRTVEIRVGQIGFPSWTKQVGKAAMKTVREKTELDHEHGVDSGAFFNGLDAMQSLITSYHEPLRRLSDR